MELKDLEGKYKLDAVDFSIERAEKWDEYYIDEDCQVCRFRLDGVVYMAVEDPEDGYRSCMRELFIDESAVMKNTFPPVEVVATHINEMSDYEAADILRIVSMAKDGGIILEVGTGNTGDYYPFFVADFRPENIPGGQSK